MSKGNSDLAVIVSANTDPMRADLRAAAKEVQSFQKNIQRQRSEVVGDLKVKTDAAAAAAAHKKAAKESAAAWKETRQSLSTIASAAAAAVTIPVVGAAAIVGIRGLSEAYQELRESVRMAADVESTRLAFEVMLNDARAAQRMVADIKRYAAETPFNSKDVTDTAKSLLAYGVAADQIIPTVRMLGDVSAAFGQDLPLKELSYLYGTLYAQQRAFTIDIKQFAGRGIPIYDELAKVMHKSVAEVKELTEAGRIGRDEVTSAFKSMTSEGGKFFNMTKRQAETFNGALEQMRDAWDMAKTKFGAMLIRDLGLKEMLKNSEAFANRIEQNVEVLSPFVKTVGDLGHTLGHVGMEFGRAAFQGAHFADVLADSAFPEIREAAEQLKRDIDALMNEGKAFKLEPVVISQMVFKVADELANVFIDTVKGIKDVGEGLRNDILKPIATGFQGMLRMWVEAKDIVGAATVAEKYHPPLAFEGDERIVGRFRDLYAEQVRVQRDLAALPQPTYQDIGGGKQVVIPPKFNQLEQAMFNQLTARAGELEAARRGFLKEITTPEHFPAAQHQLVVGGKVPPMPSRQDVLLGDQGLAQRIITEATRRQGIMRDKNAALVAKMLAEEVGAVVAKAVQAADIGQQIRNQIGNPLALAPVLGPFAALSPAFEGGKMEPGVRLQNDLPAGAADLKRQLRERLDPLHKDGELMRVKADLDALLAKGEISKEWHAFGWRDALMNKASQLGIGGPTQLPDGALKDSAEAVKILNQSQYGKGRQTTEDLLRELIQAVRQMDGGGGGGLKRAIEDNKPQIAPLPRVV